MLFRSGIISVVSNQIPAEMAALAKACLAGDFETARGFYRRYLALMNINFIESNPIPVKFAMSRMGLLEPVWRLPLGPPQPASQGAIERAIEEAGLLAGRGAPVAG